MFGYLDAAECCINTPLYRRARSPIVDGWNDYKLKRERQETQLSKERVLSAVSRCLSAKEFAVLWKPDRKEEEGVLGT